MSLRYVIFFSLSSPQCTARSITSHLCNICFFFLLCFCCLLIKSKRNVCYTYLPIHCVRVMTNVTILMIVSMKNRIDSRAKFRVEAKKYGEAPQKVNLLFIYNNVNFVLFFFSIIKITNISYKQLRY